MESLPTPPMAGDSALASPPGPARPEFGAEAYVPFGLPAEELLPVAPLDALLADPDVGGYLRSRRGGTGRTGSRVLRALAGLAVSSVLLALLVLLPDWRMLPNHVPLRPADTQKPLRYDASPFPALRDQVRAINADIDAGNRWASVFSRLAALAREESTAADRGVQTWARTELLVSIASKDIAPDSANDTLADETFSSLAAAPPVSFRAFSAYARILHAAPSSDEKNAALLRVVEDARGGYPEKMDASRDMLVIEAERHIAAFPPDYEENGRVLDYHWRKAAHALDRLAALAPGDAQVLSLNRRRWESVYRYFDFTLALTLDLNRIGWRESIQLDGKRYDKQMVKAILKEL